MAEITENENVNQEQVAPQTKAPAQREGRMIDDKAKWYALHVYSGFEQKVKDNLALVIEKYNLQNRIFDIVIPMEDVIEEKNGKRKLVSRKLFPGYVLIKMIYGDDIWHAVTRTPGITAFCGALGRAEAMSEEEVKRLKLEEIKVEVDLAVGDKIEIIDGPLSAMVGVITSLDPANQKLRADVNMFGRDMPVDLEFTQIRRI